jgi:hypothetical protein
MREASVLNMCSIADIKIQCWIFVNQSKESEPEHFRTGTAAIGGFCLDAGHGV